MIDSLLILATGIGLVWITVLVTTAGIRREIREVKAHLGVKDTGRGYRPIPGPAGSAKKDRGVLLKILVIIIIVGAVIFFASRG